MGEKRWMRLKGLLTIVLEGREGEEVERGRNKECGPLNGKCGPLG